MGHVGAEKFSKEILLSVSNDYDYLSTRFYNYNCFGEVRRKL